MERWVDVFFMYPNVSTTTELGEIAELAPSTVTGISNNVTKLCRAMIINEAALLDMVLEGMGISAEECNDLSAHPIFLLEISGLIEEAIDWSDADRSRAMALLLMPTAMINLYSIAKSSDNPNAIRAAGMLSEISGLTGKGASVASNTQPIVMINQVLGQEVPGLAELTKGRTYEHE